MAEKPVKELSFDEKLKLLGDFLERAKDEVAKGRAIVFVDKELLEWLGKQVEAGKYNSRSHAIEVLILEKMKE